MSTTNLTKELLFLFVYSLSMMKPFVICIMFLWIWICGGLGPHHELIPRSQCQSQEENTKHTGMLSNVFFLWNSSCGAARGAQLGLVTLLEWEQDLLHHLLPPHSTILTFQCLKWVHCFFPLHCSVFITETGYISGFFHSRDQMIFDALHVTETWHCREPWLPSEISTHIHLTDWLHSKSYNNPEVLLLIFTVALDMQQETQRNKGCSSENKCARYFLWNI